MNKIAFKIVVEENDVGGITWRTSILGQKGQISRQFAEKIYDDLGIEIEQCDYETNQLILD